MRPTVLSLFLFCSIALAFGQTDTITYYSSGNIMERVGKVNGVLHGKYTMYSEDGKTNVEGAFENGKHVGEWTQYYNDGNIGRKLTYENDQIIYLKEYGYGKILSEGQILNNQKHGQWKKYFLNEAYLAAKDVQPKIEQIGHFKNGIPHGETKHFNEDGTIGSIIEYNEGNIVSNKSYWANGQLISDCTYINGQLQGKCVSYDEDGRIWIETNYVNNKMDGPYKSYKFGTLHVEGTYKGDLKHGYWKLYESGAGEVTSEGNYSNGVKEGLWKEDERLAAIVEEGYSHSIGEYKNGVKTGEWKYYNGTNNYVKSKFF